MGTAVEVFIMLRMCVMSTFPLTLPFLLDSFNIIGQGVSLCVCVLEVYVGFRKESLWGGNERTISLASV